MAGCDFSLFLHDAKLARARMTFHKESLTEVLHRATFFKNAGWVYSFVEIKTYRLLAWQQMKKVN